MITCSVIIVDFLVNAWFITNSILGGEFGPEPKFPYSQVLPRCLETRAQRLYERYEIIKQGTQFIQEYAPVEVRDDLL